MSQTVETGFPAMLYFKCPQGHITACKTDKMRQFYCKECNSIFQKKDCDRFTDSWNAMKRIRKVPRTITYKEKRLYKFPESSRQDYHRNRRRPEALSVDVDKKEAA